MAPSSWRFSGLADGLVPLHTFLGHSEHSQVVSSFCSYKICPLENTLLCLPAPACRPFSVMYLQVQSLHSVDGVDISKTTREVATACPNLGHTSLTRTVQDFRLPVMVIADLSSLLPLLGTD